MKKFSALIFAFVLVAASIACSINPSTIFATPTPVPTNTPTITPSPIPTNTPTSTPTPVAVKGVDIPVRVSGVSFLLQKVSMVQSWSMFDQTFTPTKTGDMFLVVIFDTTGDVSSVNNWSQGSDSEQTAQVQDNRGRTDRWSIIQTDTNTNQATFIFVVDASAKNYIFSFPDGTEIDLGPFLK